MLQRKTAIHYLALTIHSTHSPEHSGFPHWTLRVDIALTTSAFELHLVSQCLFRVIQNILKALQIKLNDLKLTSLKSRKLQLI